MGVYIERPQEYLAMQFLGDPASNVEIAEWLRSGWMIEVRISANIPTRPEEMFEPRLQLPSGVLLTVGTWLVWNVGTNIWLILSNDEFQQNYKEVNQ